MNVTVLTFCLLWDDLYVTVVAIARVCKAHISITCVSHVLRSLQTSHSVALTQHELDVSVFFFLGPQIIFFLLLTFGPYILNCLVPFIKAPIGDGTVDVAETKISRAKYRGPGI